MASSLEFFEQFGEYVYCYTKDGTYQNAYYKGKGVGDRCTHHVKEKGYDISECYIVARNLEKFKKKSPSFLLESWLIWENDPQDNRVSGHYKECFIMQNLNFLRDEYDTSQRDLWEETHNFLNNNAATFKGRLGRVETKSSISRIETPWKQGLNFTIIIRTSSDKYTCIIQTNATPDKFTAKQEAFAKAYPDISAMMTNTSIEWEVDTSNEAVEAWNAFYNAVA